VRQHVSLRNQLRPGHFGMFGSERVRQAPCGFADDLERSFDRKLQLTIACIIVELNVAREIWPSRRCPKDTRRPALQAA
jgi:hypothetical protein